MQSTRVTILIPNFRTFDITVLCLRLLRKHTDPAHVRVVVIDNNSGDKSIKYLRGLRWIQLIERVPQIDESGPLSHARALDEGFSQVRTPYVVVMHTDTLVKQPDWLSILLHPLNHDANVAGVGTWKLEPHTLTSRVRRIVMSCLNRCFPGWKSGYQTEGGTQMQYLRSHCAVYRTDLLVKHGLRFAECGDRWPAGKVLHDRLVSLGYSMQFLSPEMLSRHITHLGHATMVLNPELGASRRTIAKGIVRIRRAFKELNADQILNDSSLDE